VLPRYHRIVLMIVLLAGLTGCAVTRVGDNLPYGVLNHDDIELVGEGLPTYLLTIDGLIENWPDSTSLLSSGASLYSAYAGLFVEDAGRAARLSARALLVPVIENCVMYEPCPLMSLKPGWHVSVKGECRFCSRLARPGPAIFS
jgi:hypothetical protein